MSKKKSKTPVPPTAEDVAVEFQKTEDLRAALRRCEANLARAKDKTEALINATFEACKDAALSMGPVPPVKSPKADLRKRPEVALIHLTDWQGGKRTQSYNSDIMRERVMECMRKVDKITTIQRADHPVRHCVIALGGDMCEGAGFNFPTQSWEMDSGIFLQFVNVSRVLVEAVREALRIYETVEVIAEWGNHGRIGSKRDSVPANDNFDRMIYENARIQLKDEARLVWRDCPEDVQRIVVGNYKALLLHGDEIGRNGYASKVSIAGHVTKWLSGSYKVDGQSWLFRDAYVGHYHTHEEYALPNGLGAVYFSGSTESDNRYAGINLASSATPSQRLHFIDPIKGRVTSQFKIILGE
jgi:hypothetical protein